MKIKREMVVARQSPASFLPDSPDVLLRQCSRRFQSREEFGQRCRRQPARPVGAWGKSSCRGIKTEQMEARNQSSQESFSRPARARPMECRGMWWRGLVAQITWYFVCEITYLVWKYRSTKCANNLHSTRNNIPFFDT